MPHTLGRLIDSADKPPDVHMSWVNLLFLHWPVATQSLRHLVPAELEIDTFDGTAWIALVPFQMKNSKFRGVPNLPGLSTFYECNVRTYVRLAGRAGVWFFSLDAQTLLPVLGGRWLWSLNYIYGRFEVEQPSPSETDYRLTRRPGPWNTGSTHVRWRSGERMQTSLPGSLEHFLTERYWLFTRRGGRILAGQVSHEPWPLRTAEVELLDNGLIKSAGVEVRGTPLAMASDHIDVRGWSLVNPSHW